MAEKLDSMSVNNDHSTLKPQDPRRSSAVLRERSSANVGAIDKNCNIKIPIIDMSASPENVAEQMWNAARTVGFFTIVNYPLISQSMIDAIFQVSTDFFDQSTEEKGKYPFDTGLNSGYEYMKQSPPSTPNAVDQKESMQVTARQGCMENLWPNKPVNFRESVEHMMKSSHQLACTIMSLLESKACPHLKPGTLANSHNIWNKDGQCMLRLIRYPPTDETKLNNNNLWRAGPHTDWGCITLLFQRMGEEGLECHANPQGDAKCIEVPPVLNGITVNVGDMLKRWSDCKLLSNMHRVRMPREIDECKKSRYSVAFFLQADKSALIESPTEEPITAGVSKSFILCCLCPL